ncbi:D-alanyl-D-alanine carboxypeptidase [Streptomyces roseochromogenus]|uniref:D-alanyl-D-alanine carboxypeptidase n=1 Tax=Streptomyces roseochromogenus TaxID=285450 RepID=UPI0004CE01D7|nr:D-alanyl-D-alanine carboxypeptidase [Streptomyces roseochromogenus]
MAGESPDRSKQRESSAEPTSGSAGPVPETRDPRLAVAREKDSAQASADTATKILSIPDAPKPDTKETPAEDAALRQAVSAWVRTAAPANNSDTPANTPPTTPSATAGTETEAETAGARNGTAEEGKPETTDADADAKGYAEAESAGAKPDTDVKAGAKADAAPKAGDDGETADAGAAAEARTRAEAGSEAAPVAEAGSDGDAEAKAEAGSGAEPKAEAEEAKDGPKARGGSENEDRPEDANGGDAPQGPPAADDESRTGGAGGNTDADGEAEADAPHAEAPQAKAAVDQPTAVFKTVKPKQVDQPTTMLKLGGRTNTPKTPESESERTSKFVALKNDMAPATKPPAAKPDVTTPVPQVGPERTTQQPLPPKPPLDLLAELTNTPPPPETAVRTIVRRVKIWTPLVLLLAVIFAVVQAVRPLPAPALGLTAKDSYTFDGAGANLPWPGEGQGWMDVDGIGTMSRFGKQTPVAIGSVAKTMTSYIVLRDHPLKPGQEGPKITVDPQAEKEGGYSKSGESTVNTLKAGDRISEKQALSAVMIPSANNIARLLARWDAGSEAAFVKKMNDTAKELGMTSTTYTDPSGLKETTVSTAEDQVKLGRMVVKNPALVAITSAASWTDPTGHNWPNWNKLPFQMGAIGIKTGSTTAAGGNLLFASRKTVGGQTVTIVGAILGQHKGPSILDTVNAVSKTALLAAQDALTSSTILKKGDVVGYVDDQLGGHTPVVITKDVTAVGWAGLKVKLSFAPGGVPHTAKAGTKVGTLTVGDGSAAAVKVPVALQKDLAEPGFGAKLTRLG